MTDNPLSPWGNMTHIVESGIKELTKPGIAERYNGKLDVSITEVNSLYPLKTSSHIKSNFTSDQDLISSILSSCYIPLYYETSTSPLQLDGGLTNNLIQKGITVSPEGTDEAVIKNRREVLPWKSSVWPGEKEDCEVLERMGREDADAYIFST